MPRPRLFSSLAGLPRQARGIALLALFTFFGAEPSPSQETPPSPTGETSVEVERQDETEPVDPPETCDPSHVYRNRSVGFSRGIGGKTWARGVENGLDWLANAQSPTGLWKSEEHGGNKSYDAGVSGLALLAFFGAGFGPDSEKYGETIRAALDVLLERQSLGGIGTFGPRTTNHTYDHGICTAAIAEAYGLSGRRDLKRSAMKAIEYLKTTKSPEKGWRYGRGKGESDTSVTGWMLMALKSAEWAGVEIEGRLQTEGLRTIEDLTGSDGKVGYSAKSRDSVRLVPALLKFPVDSTEAMTAVGLNALLFHGESKNSPTVSKMTNRLLALLPKWDTPQLDMYYWYHGTMAMFQRGSSPWQKWSRALGSTLPRNQISKDGPFKGSWNPAGPWGSEGGRVYSTALMILCLEAPYRYPRVAG